MLFIISVTILSMFIRIMHASSSWDNKNVSKYISKLQYIIKLFMY